MMHTLSKSDFQLASSCPKKLVYKKANYPSSNDTNEYMVMLAQGGHIVGHMATLLFPEGIEIIGSTTESVAKTQNYLKQDNCILFEAAIQSGQKIIRIDILKKTGNRLELIEVKAKSHHSAEDAAKQKSKLEKYIEDVAFQYLVLTEAYPQFSVECLLLMPDKAKRTQIDGLAGWFTASSSADSQKEIKEIITQQQPKFKKPTIVFKYEQQKEKDTYINQLQKDGILDYMSVTAEVIKILPIIKERANLFLHILDEGITSSHFQINKNCKSCEFNTSDHLLNGYKECWGDLAIEEDIGDGDHSALSSIPADAIGKAKLLVKDDGILAGVELALFIFNKIDSQLKVEVLLHDGAEVKFGDIAFYVNGSERSILQAERLVLNFMQRMSGIATTTSRLVKLIEGTNCKLLDTRKTTPGLRIIEKWAVKIGGGYNHRVGLYDMIMLKDNHVDYCGGIERAIDSANKYNAETGRSLAIEIETRNLNDVARVIAHGGVQRIMIDNFSVEDARKAVSLINHTVEVEASGGITEATLRQYAETGVDFISVGALTHSVKSLDLSLKATL
jgi:nicotinate-nucleotide pyrophosphorylase (carboxylating)